MITEIDGVLRGDKGSWEKGNIHIDLADDEEGTVELEMDLETFEQLRESLNKAHKLIRKAQRAAKKPRGPI